MTTGCYVTNLRALLATMSFWPNVPRPCELDCLIKSPGRGPKGKFFLPCWEPLNIASPDTCSPFLMRNITDSSFPDKVTIQNAASNCSSSSSNRRTGNKLDVSLKPKYSLRLAASESTQKNQTGQQYSNLLPQLLPRRGLL